MANVALKNRKQANATTGKQAGFTVVVSGDLVPFKANQELTLERQIIEYGKVLGTDNDVDMTALTDAQVMQCMSIDVKNMPADEADLARIDAMEKVIEAKDNAIEDMTGSPDEPIGTQGASALALGNLVSANSQKIVERGLDGKKTWDGCPIVFLGSILKDFKDAKDEDGSPLMRRIPWIGTKKWGKTSTKTGKSTDNIPAGWNKPTQFYKVDDATATKPYRNWLVLFVEQWPEIKTWGNEVRHLSAWLSDKNVIVTNPTDRVKEAIASGEKEAIEGLKNEISGDINLVIGRCTRALAFHQVKEYITENFQNMGVVYSAYPDVDIDDLTPEQLVIASRRLRPIRMGTVNKRGRLVLGPEISMSQFVGYGKYKNGEPNLLDKCKASEGKSTLADLYKESRKRTPDASKQDANGNANPSLPASATNAPKIVNASQFGDVLNQVFQYLDTRDLDTTLLPAIRGKDGGRIASEVIQVKETIEGFLAAYPAVTELAVAYNNDQVQASADAAKAATEQARADKEKKAA